MTVKELREKLKIFDDDDLIMLHPIDAGAGYYPNVDVRAFTASTGSYENPIKRGFGIVVLGVHQPYISVPFSVIEAGWRPT